MQKAETAQEESKRIKVLTETLRLTVFRTVSRGLFEDHKLIFLTQLLFNLLKTESLETPDGDFSHEGLSYLIRRPKTFEENEQDWLPDSAWHAVCALAELEGFENFRQDILENAPRFKDWYNETTPEMERLPLEWRELEKLPFRKLLVVQALRPDRMTIAMARYIDRTLPNGFSYTRCDSGMSAFQVLEQTFDDSSPKTPIYFILSKGADVASNVDQLARTRGMVDGENYFNISLGQGQDTVAMETLRSACREGWWVVLNNVHLMPRWLLTLEKLLDDFAIMGSHEKFRVFLTSDPSPAIPVGILNRSLKLTNEPPSGLKANLKRAWSQFTKEEVEFLDGNTKTMLFGLCYFHSVMVGRKNFGEKGFNMQYPFSTQDLLAAATVLQNYMEAASGVPWENLKYLFGEILYGGHIVVDHDRLLTNTFLDYFFCEQLLDEMEMYPYASGQKVRGFKMPPPSSYQSYAERIENDLDGSSPRAFGLHPNAEIGFRMAKSDNMFDTIFKLQPITEMEGGEGKGSAQHIAEAMSQDIVETFRDVEFDINAISRELDEDAGPFQYFSCKNVNGCRHCYSKLYDL